MENQNTNNQIVMTPVELLSVVQQKIGKIPFDIEHETTVGTPLRECVILIEQVKRAISTPPPEQPETQKSEEKKESVKKKVLPLKPVK